MSSTKNVSKYMAIVFSGVIGFQSLALGQGTTSELLAAMPPAPVVKASTTERVSLSATAIVTGRKIIDSEKFAKYADLAGDVLDDKNVAAQAIRVRDALKAMAQGLDSASREPYHNENYSDWQNRWLNRAAVGQIFLNQFSQILAAMEFTNARTDAFLLAVPMLTAVLLKNLTSADTLVSPEAIHQQLQQAMDEAKLDESVKKEIDDEITAVRDATNKLLNSRSALNQYVLQYGYNLSSGSWYSISNMIAYGSFLHAFLELFAGKWKAAAAAANGLEEVGRIINKGASMANEVAAVAKEAQLVTREALPIMEKIKQGVGLTTVKLGTRGGKTAGTASVGTANVLDGSAYAFASTSTETLNSVQELNTVIKNAVLRINGHIRVLQAASSQGK
jgi:hypothetical protein